jgi:hypothetical protein
MNKNVEKKEKGKKYEKDDRTSAPLTTNKKKYIFAFFKSIRQQHKQTENKQ